MDCEHQERVGKCIKIVMFCAGDGGMGGLVGSHGSWHSRAPSVTNVTIRELDRHRLDQ